MLCFDWLYLCISSWSTQQTDLSADSSLQYFSVIHIGDFVRAQTIIGFGWSIVCLDVILLDFLGGGGICRVPFLLSPPTMLVNMYTHRIGTQGDCESVDMQTLSRVWCEINVSVCIQIPMRLTLKFSMWQSVFDTSLCPAISLLCIAYIS